RRPRARSARLLHRRDVDAEAGVDVRRRPAGVEGRPPAVRRLANRDLDQRAMAAARALGGPSARPRRGAGASLQSPGVAVAAPAPLLPVRSAMKTPALLSLIWVAACVSAPAAPTWQGDVLPVIASNCVKCHGYPAEFGAPAGFRLDVLEDSDAIDPTTNWHIHGAQTMY